MSPGGQFLVSPNNRYRCDQHSHPARACNFDQQQRALSIGGVDRPVSPRRIISNMSLPRAFLYCSTVKRHRAEAAATGR